MKALIDTLNIPAHTKALLLENFLSQEKIIAEKEAQLKQVQQQYHALLEQFKLARQRRFSPSSESAAQLSLFDEADLPLSQAAKADVADEDDDRITVTYQRRRKQKPKRKPLPAHLPREDVWHDLTDAEKICQCGACMTRIGEEVTEQLDIIPAKLYVIRHRRHKYACRTCDEGIKVAPMPRLFLPKSQAAPGLVAHTITSKYVDHLPLYRQEHIWKRFGVEIPRNTTCAWVMKSAALCEPLVDCLKANIITYDYAQADETRVQVLNEPNRPNTSKSYLWCYKGGPADTQSVVFEYQTSRSSTHPRTFLAGFTGALQTDGYIGYPALAEEKQLIHVGCMAHARRPFAELVKLSRSQTPGLAHEAMGYFKQLYAIETLAREQQLTPEQRYQLRVEKAKPVLDAFYAWLTRAIPKAPPRLKIGKALHYVMKHWPMLTAYLKDGRYEIDNNGLENCIRPFALGRRNWLFKGSPRGARAGATLYSLIATCKANNIDPYAYFRACFERIRLCKTEKDYRQLLPQNIQLP